MHCAACGHENRPGRKFCGECGAALALACAACGTANEPGEKFCGECGAALGSDAPARAPAAPARRGPDDDVRKVVTIVFADLVGSTALHERLDPESVRRVMDRYYAALRAAVDAHGGTVVKLLGDGVMAAFGLKRVAEDDALRAVRAAAAMQDAFRALVQTHGAALGAAGIRVAVNTGEVVVTGAQDDVLGDPVNVAARLQEQARDGDVVLGEATRRLVGSRVTLAPLGSVALKGRAEAVAAYRLISLEPPAGAVATPFVGREEELARLEAVYAAAIATPGTRLAVLVGSPGLGKSRLIDEVARRHGEDATILAAHCDAAGGATFAPIAQALRRFLGLADGATGESVRTAVAAVLPGDGDDGERARIAGGIAGLLGGSAMSPEETFFVVRRFFAGLTAARPVVLIVDDVHWAEPLLLDLVEHLVQWGTGVPLFVLIGARPELRELRSSLATAGGVVADAVVLGGLDAGAAMRLAAGVIGAADLPAAVAAKVLATSEGNPLFVGELVRMLVQEGALTKAGDRWTVGANLAALEMPPTIHALLAARIERLGSDDRTVLERAAVVGRHFSRSAVAALLGANGAELDVHLESLRRSELIERDTGWLLGEPVMRFHHVLIRDAAYRRLLKGTRADLHARLADWIEGQVGDAPEHDEMIGWHLEQSHQLLRELGPLDAAGSVLGERAARRLAAAGRRALMRDDVALAAGLLGRAIVRLGGEAPERADLVLDWCEALLAAGDVGPAADAIGELDRIARDAAGSARLRAWHTCFAGQLTVLTAPEALHATADRVGAAARDLAALGDAAGEAKAHFVHAQALGRLGKIGASEAALDQALAAARRAGDRRRANAVLAGAPLAALWGPSPVTRASGRCLDVVRVLRITQGAPAVEAVALSCQGVLEALRGRTEAARRMLASSRTMVEELGISHRLYETEVFAGRIDLLEGDAPAAERALRSGYHGLRDLGLGIDAARAAALLGHALLAQDRAAEAETLSHESELLAGDDLQAAIAWRGVRAEALARRGDHAAAIAFAEAAVAIAAATDALLDHADARLALAAAFRAGGRRAEADAEERRAFALWEAKGATVLAERARRATHGAVPAAPPPEARAEPRRRRRVCPNAATAALARVEAALAARDLQAMGPFVESFAEVSHPTGTTYGREQMLLSLERFLRLPGARVRHEILATLGNGLVLVRRWMGASAAGRERFDVGEYEKEEFAVFEVDARGAHVRSEIFGADYLGAAMARLYERYAETLPDGPSREHAAVAAQAVAYVLTTADVRELSLIYAATYEDVDHRTVGYGHVSGEALGKLDQSLQALADDLRFRIDDVLALEPRGFVRTTTSAGTWREGGGAFERTVCTLTVFSSDGRIDNHETFDADREVEALARFDALTADAVPGPPPRRRGRLLRILRANAATAAVGRLDAALAARDEAAFADTLADTVAVVDHANGADFGRDGLLWSLQQLLRMDDPTIHHEPLATLGASLALFRQRIGGRGGRLDVGAYERDELCIYDVDSDGRFRHVESFPAERLRAAIVRLYERYTASLPEGPARIRPESVARALAVYDGPLDPDRIASGHSPSFVCVDHRIFSTWSAEGREPWRRHWQEQAELAAAFTPRDDDVLALDPGAYVLRTTFGGVGRASGGTVENVVISVNIHDADGLIMRVELFEPDQEAEALACFERFTAEGTPRPAVRRPVRPNAASRTFGALEAAFARRDLAAVDALLADPLETIEHPTGTTYGRDGQLESTRWMMRLPDLVFRIEPLATLGESFCLGRRFVAASGNTAGSRFEVGAYEIESLVVNVVDAAGRITSAEVFAPDRLGSAIARLHTRYAESVPAGPERTRAEGIARNYTFWNGVPDPEGFRNVLASAFVMVDHRSLATWSAADRDEWVRHWRAQAELAEGFARRDDDLLAFTPAVHVLRQTFVGISRASDGPFENVVLAVCVFDADGRNVRAESYEPDQEALALARFDELIAGEQPAPPPRRRVQANAGTPSLARFQSALAARDRDAIADVFAESLQFIHHPTGATYGRRETLGKWRSIMKAERVSFLGEALGTLGEMLVLERHALAIDGLREGHLTEFGRIEFDEAVVIEVDEAGRWCRVELFEAERLGDAVARLYARHAERLPEGPARIRAEMTARAVATMLTRSTEHRLEDVSTPDIEAVDHRAVGMGTVSGPDLWTRWRAASDELMERQSFRIEDVLALGPDALLRRTTETGTVRASGGAFENGIWILSIFGPDGRQARIELFDVGREAEALARFDALTAGAAPAPPPSVRGRVRTNVAARTVSAADAAFARRDMAALTALIDPSYEESDHRTGAGWDQQGALDSFRRFMRARDPAYRNRPLATLGDTLMLSCRLVAAAGSLGARFDVGPYESEAICLIEADGQRGVRRQEVFALDRFGDAVVRLYERHAELLTEGPARVRAAAMARAVAIILHSAADPDRFAAALTPEIVAVDHRTVGSGELHGRDVVVAAVRALLEPSEGVTWRHDELLALSEHAVLTRATQRGRSRASGGEWERPICTLFVHGADGLAARWETFEAEQEAEALARYDALVAASGEPAPRASSDADFSNAATRSLDRFARVTAARDWDGLGDLIAARLRFDDRRPLFRMQLGKEGFLQQHRVLFDVPNARWVMRTIATRGERLTLAQILLQGDVADGGGALEIDHRGVIEVNDDGRMTAIVLFEPADLDAAYAELEARFAAGEGARHPPILSQFSRAIARRDWDAVAAMCGPGFAEHDHRSLALLGVSRDPETWVQNFRVQVDLAPDTVARFEHSRPCPRGNLWTLTWEGSRDGGRYEIPMVGVTELDGQGKLARVDLYDPEQLDQARARFAELAPPARSAEPFANAASATVAPVIAALIAHDWERFAAFFTDDFRMSDRRRVVQLELDRERYVAFTREIADGRTIRATSELLATRGERLALTRRVQEFRDADVGPSEIAFLILTESDPRGGIAGQVRWDVEDLAAAYVELDRRWQAIEHARSSRVAAFHVAFTRALAARDWDGLAVLLSPTLVAHDHRLVGWDVRHGPDAYVDVVRAMVDLAPDADGRLDHARTCAHGFLAEVVWVGTRDGGAFESPFVWVVELDDAGRAARFDFYDPHHLEAARARFAEIDCGAPQAALAASTASPGGTPDPLAAIAAPNPATAWWDRWRVAQAVGADTGNWDAMRALVAPGFVFDDRQRHVLVHGDVELFIASARERAATGARPEGTPVGTAGERVAIEKMLWSGGPSDGRFEIEYLAVIEVDEAGRRIVALILYDLDDARAAQRDAWARWAAIEPAVAPWVEAVETLVDNFDAHDRERLVAPFADDVVVEDHRRTGFGRIEGAAAYAEAVAVLWELAPDHHVDLGWFWPAVERHGFVITLDRFGTLADGGAFESHALWLLVAVGGRITRAELFELEDLDRARARLAELRPDPLRIPPNAATRWVDRWSACAAARDWEGLERLYAPNATFDDRRRLLRLSGDRATAIANTRFMMESGKTRIARTLVATAGDRLALERMDYSGGAPGADFAVDTLMITEIDADGRGLAFVTFDVGDRAAASAELFERYAALGADGTTPAALDTMRAWNVHDKERLRALLPADFYLDDHRRTGVGRLEGRDAYVDSLAALWELSRDIRVETLCSFAITPHGRLWLNRWFGSNAEGGEFDAVYVCVGFHFEDHGCLEIFELEDFDAARARYAELCGTPS